tara:strand:+ start:645 stop:1595 length:951 start_codon:yes stop_codon:yes gene_type:complete
VKHILFLIITLSITHAEQHDIKPPRGYLNNTFLKWSAMFGWIDLVNTKPDIPPDIEAFIDVKFKETEQRSLFLDVYREKGINNSMPLIIFVHGGSWTKGDKKDYLIYLLSYAQKGYVTASLSYRFSQEEKFPAAVKDVICGIKWLKNNAMEYGIDSNNVAIVGGSAGAHLALMAAYSVGDSFGEESCESGSASQKVNAVVNFYGPTDLTTDYAINRKETNFFIGADYKSQPEKYLIASPIHYVTKDDPPTMTFIGTLDELVPLNQTNKLDQSLKKVDVYHDYHILKGWPHTMDAARPVNNYTQHYMDKFFKQFLRD